MRHLLLTLLCTTLLTACVETHIGVRSTSDTFDLGEVTAEDGTRIQHRVQADFEAGPALIRRRTESRDVPYLGLNVRAIDRSVANARGLEAWKGVLVSSVTDGTAAATAGLRVGQVLLSLDGVVLSGVDQFRDVVASDLAPGVPCVVARLIASESEGGWLRDELELTPAARRVDEAATERTALAWSKELLRRTGLQLASVPAEMAHTVGVGDVDLALVAGVISGSRAYNEGLRAGDRVLRCNGQAVASAAEVERLLRAGSGRLELAVTGPLGDHTATVRTDERLDRRRSLNIPIIVEHQSTVARSSTSFLDFIFQFGFNHDWSAYPSATREPATRSSLSILPFGMFEFERSPEERRTTLFWWITFRSRR